jgi:hypothetical protein
MNGSHRLSGAFRLLHRIDVLSNKKAGRSQDLPAFLFYDDQSEYD